MKRESFLFYRSFYEAIRDLPRDIQGEIYTAIMEYGLYGNETDNLKPIARSIFMLVRPQLDANIKRYENGCKGGRPNEELPENEEKNSRRGRRNSPAKETNQEPNKNQKETNQEPNVNDNDVAVATNAPAREKQPQALNDGLSSVDILRNHFFSRTATENLMMSVKIPTVELYRQLCEEVFAEMFVSRGSDFAVTTDVKYHVINLLRAKMNAYRKNAAPPRQGDMQARLDAFAAEIAQEKERCGYDSDMCNAFFNHWTQSSGNGNMRFEDERYWDTAKRLASWKLREKT